MKHEVKRECKRGPYFDDISNDFEEDIHDNHFEIETPNKNQIWLNTFFKSKG